MSRIEQERAELHIERLTNEGDGVGRSAEGLVVFVPFSAPGDLVRVRITERRPRFLRAEIEELLEEGPGRSSPRCAVFGRCGGCAWQHLKYGAQLDAKREILSSALERIGKLQLQEELRIFPSPRPYEYRIRTRMRVRTGQLGYFERGSRRYCPVEECPILMPSLKRRWASLRAEAPAPDGLWELAAGYGAEDAEQRVRAFPMEALQGERELDEEPVELVVGRDRISISPGGFYQGNPLLYDALAEKVWSAVGEGDALLELYCGSGFFTLELARRFARVRALEENPTAVADLRGNLRRAGIENVEVIQGRAELALQGLPAGEGWQVVFLDPPRAGLEASVREALLAFRPQRLVYLSCNPATLARDLAQLCATGYELVSVEGIDLFPQTPHVEALAILERS